MVRGGSERLCHGVGLSLEQSEGERSEGVRHMKLTGEAPTFARLVSCL